MVLGHPKFQSQPVLEKRKFRKKMSWLSWNPSELNGSSSSEKENQGTCYMGYFPAHHSLDSQMVPELVSKPT